MKSKGSTGPGSRIAPAQLAHPRRVWSRCSRSPWSPRTSLGALRIAESLNDIEQLDNMKLLTEMTKQATDLASALQEERAPVGRTAVERPQGDRRLQHQVRAREDQPRP
ncbi:hypothetical protein [Streptomyces sp. KL116D]|uniref:hypothetical protein n=1 Tax=Streptomyces sp. KL116D TaxID=3045152 RepID=UPI0035566AD0